MMSLKAVGVILFLVSAICTEAVFGGCGRTKPKIVYEPIYADCLVTPNPGSEQDVRGVVTFSQKAPTEEIEIKVTLEGFNVTPARKRGIHVHQYGSIVGGCGSTGGHYNPLGKTHGGPKSDKNERHQGDFGNLMVDDEGKVNVNFTDSVASLFGNLRILGRAIVIHAGEDDLGLGGNAGSLATGNAGARLACCVIGIAPAPAS